MSLHEHKTRSRPTTRSLKDEAKLEISDADDVESMQVQIEQAEELRSPDRPVLHTVEDQVHSDDNGMIHQSERPISQLGSLNIKGDIEVASSDEDGGEIAVIQSTRPKLIHEQVPLKSPHRVDSPDWVDPGFRMQSNASQPIEDRNILPKFPQTDAIKGDKGKRDVDSTSWYYSMDLPSVEWSIRCFTG